MADQEEATKPEIENIDAAELEDSILEDVSGGSNNCNCNINPH